MLNKIQMYLVQAIYYVKSSIFISLGIYLVALLAIWTSSRLGLIKKVNFSIKNIIIKYFLWLYIIVILKITGILGMTFNINWFLDSIRGFKLSIPFVGSSIFMVTLNLLLFVPLGFLMPAALKKTNLNYKKILLSGFLFSFVIEVL